jgi:hypothetical protein
MKMGSGEGLWMARQFAKRLSSGKLTLRSPGATQAIHGIHEAFVVVGATKNR